ncbi:hypothetical protein Tco_0016712 [Tanacetum coccineum]
MSISPILGQHPSYMWQGECARMLGLPWLAIVKQPQRYGYNDERADIAFVGTGSIVTRMCQAGRCHGRTESMTADTKKKNMSGRAEYRGRDGGPHDRGIKKGILWTDKSID